MPDNSWSCVSCQECNPPYTEVCRNCGQPALPTCALVSVTQTTVRVAPETSSQLITLSRVKALLLLVAISCIYMPLVMLAVIPTFILTFVAGQPQDVPAAIWGGISTGWFRFANSTMLANGLAGALFAISLAHGLGFETSNRGHRGLLGCISFSIAYLLVRPTISFDADLGFVTEIFVGISGYVVGATLPKTISNYLLQVDAPQAARP